MRTRIAEHTAGYGDWGLWHTLFLASRIAAACGDARPLRDWMARLAGAAARAAERHAARLRPLPGLRARWPGSKEGATTRWRSGARRSRTRSSLDLLGHAVEVRVRLACALLQAGAPRRRRRRAGAGARARAKTARAAPSSARPALASWRQPIGMATSMRRRRTRCGAGSAALHPVSARSGRAAPAPPRDRRPAAQRARIGGAGAIARGESNKLIARASTSAPTR